ncbi:DUF4136 domain-containing protein [Variovorax sp. J22R133]|uniref:DUF4136 domain-containing protein n=1 Tax=Variovorax brevis TaxID=3053503 RepID=UPI002575FF15|nr:DUF4136 domain-containing protein [Variovorax sp. J22R133]MDM0115087.1 DUF4136 domain-containing protein [Variovorax sp. J22R133]
MKHTLTALFLPLTAAALLTGCATSWTVDSKVSTFSKLQGSPAQATYRFERLPSQQAQEATQQELEAMASAALQSVGLTRDDASPRYSAQIAARVSVEISPWADPWFYPGWGAPYFYGGMGYGRGWPYGRGYGPGWYGGGWAGWYGPAYASNPWYTREVSVVLRELPANQIVYETRAYNDGPYNLSGPVFAVMFQAAMQGFPNPPAGVRRVDIQIPTASTSSIAPQAAAAAPPAAR